MIETTITLEARVDLPMPTGRVAIDMEVGNRIARLGMLLRENEPSIGPHPAIQYEVFDERDTSTPIWSLQEGGCIALNLALRKAGWPASIVVRFCGPEKEIKKWKGQLQQKVEAALTERDACGKSREGGSHFGPEGDRFLEVDSENNQVVRGVMRGIQTLFAADSPGKKLLMSK